MKHLKRFNEGWFSKGEKSTNPEVEKINDKILDAAYGLRAFGTLTKHAAFINGAKWAIHNLSDEEIKLLRDNTDKDDFSVFGMK